MFGRKTSLFGQGWDGFHSFHDTVPLRVPFTWTVLDHCPPPPTLPVIWLFVCVCVLVSRDCRPVVLPTALSSPRTLDLVPHICVKFAQQRTLLPQCRT